MVATLIGNDVRHQDPMFQKVCELEGLDPGLAESEIEAGRMVYLRSMASRTIEDFSPILVGTTARKKIAALVGLGPDVRDPGLLIDDIHVILVARPDCVMDLTTSEASGEVRRQLKQRTKIPVGGCITYDLFRVARKVFSRSEFSEQFEASLATGIDFALIHAGIDRRVLEMMLQSGRIMPTTSRGGGLVSRYMSMHGRENPLVEYFDDLVVLAKKYDVVLDLGDVFRPGCLADAGDGLKLEEIRVIAALREKALTAGVQVLCESGGHIPLTRIPEIISSYKALLGGAPLWLAGPMPIDTGVAFDSVVNTLGIAAAAQHGGDMFASITDNEHYAMPTATDTAHAVRNARVALEAVAVSAGDAACIERNRQMGIARGKNAWATQATHALYPDLATQVFLQHGLLRDGKPCTICGGLCPHIVVSNRRQGEE